MSLTIEWRKRLDHWRRVLAQQFYRPLAEVGLEGFTTLEQLTPTQAAGGAFTSMPAGMPWGAKFEYGWFRCSPTVPQA